MEHTNRPSKHMRLTGIFNDDTDFIEITEWSNGEGYDIQTIEKGMGLQHVSWSHETIEALIHLFTAKGNQ